MGLKSLPDLVPFTVLLSTAPSFFAVWMPFRVVSVVLPKKVYGQADDFMWGLYQRFVLFFFEKCCPVEVWWTFMLFYGSWVKFHCFLGDIPWGYQWSVEQKGVCALHFQPPVNRCSQGLRSDSISWLLDWVMEFLIANWLIDWLIDWLTSVSSLCSRLDCGGYAGGAAGKCRSDAIRSKRWTALFAAVWLLLLPSICKGGPPDM